jgi:hypothetical protein
MNNESSVWDEVFDQAIDHTTDRVIEIMEEQCRYLKEKTEGVVKARFAMVKLTYPTMAEESPLHAAIAEYARTHVVRSPIDANALRLKDAGISYSPRRYGFDVYNDTYEFRPFVAEVGALYPVKLSIDETIAKESRGDLKKWLEGGEGNVAQVDSDDDLLGCFYAIVKSRKMRYILNMLRGSC